MIHSFHQKHRFVTVGNDPVIKLKKILCKNKSYAYMLTLNLHRHMFVCVTCFEVNTFNERYHNENVYTVIQLQYINKV